VRVVVKKCRRKVCLFRFSRSRSLFFPLGLPAPILTLAVKLIWFNRFEYVIAKCHRRHTVIQFFSVAIRVAAISKLVIYCLLLVMEYGRPESKAAGICLFTYIYRFHLNFLAGYARAVMTRAVKD
jgi:hypothetical protein